MTAFDRLNKAIDDAVTELHQAIDDARARPAETMERLRFAAEANRLNARRGVLDLRARRNRAVKDYEQ